jgi:hypothetical protein
MKSEIQWRQEQTRKRLIALIDECRRPSWLNLYGLLPPAAQSAINAAEAQLKAMDEASPYFSTN